MEYAQEIAPSASESIDTPGTPGRVSQAASRSHATLVLQEGDGHCSCGGSGNPDGPQTASYPPVYAVGRIEWRFPTASIEKEFAQATGRVETTGLTDRQGAARGLVPAPTPLSRPPTLLGAHHCRLGDVHFSAPRSGRLRLTRRSSAPGSLAC